MRIVIKTADTDARRFIELARETEAVRAGGYTDELLEITITEIAEDAPDPDTVTIPRSDLTALLAGAAALGKYPADVPGLLKPLVEDVLKRYKVRLEMTL